MRKRKLTINLNPELIKRVEDAAVLQDRSFISVLEIALAEHLCAPVADPAFPEAPVEVCHKCRKAVMWRSRCPVCGWWRPRTTRARV